MLTDEDDIERELENNDEGVDQYLDGLYSALEYKLHGNEFKTPIKDRQNKISDSLDNDNDITRDDLG